MDILIIDDERFFASNLCALISQLPGLECHTAYQPSDALKAVQINKYDLVICDIRLGDKSGEELIPEINELKPGIPFVVVSAYEFPESLKNNPHLNILKFYEKPFDTKRFCEEIYNGLTKHTKGGT